MYAIQGWATEIVYPDRYPTKKLAEERALRVEKEWRDGGFMSTVNVVTIAKSGKMRVVSQAVQGKIEPFEN